MLMRERSTCSSNKSHDNTPCGARDLVQIAAGENPVEFLRRYFDKKEISAEFTVRANVNPTRFVEQAYFTLHLVKQPDGPSLDPIFTGLFSAGRPNQSIPGWLDGDFFDNVQFPNGTGLSISYGSLDIGLFRMLGALIPDGGSFMISYSLSSKESKIHRETKLGLDRGYPPVATPLGFLLFIAGCGMGFKDWYFAEGGREGPEKLQGYKPSDARVAKQKARVMLGELHQFFIQSPNDDLAHACKLRAEQVMRELEDFVAQS
jgi:hypothetical protein